MSGPHEPRLQTLPPQHYRRRRTIRREGGREACTWGAGSSTWIGLLEALLTLGEALLKALLAGGEATRHASSLCPWVLRLGSKLGLLLALRLHARLRSVLLLSWKVMGPIGGLLHALGGILGVALRREALAVTGVWVTCVVALLMCLRVPADDQKLYEDKVPCWHKAGQQSRSADGAELTTAWGPLAAEGWHVFVGFVRSQIL